MPCRKLNFSVIRLCSEGPSTFWRWRPLTKAEGVMNERSDPGVTGDVSREEIANPDTKAFQAKTQNPCFSLGRGKHITEKGIAAVKMPEQGPCRPIAQESFLPSVYCTGLPIFPATMSAVWRTSKSITITTFLQRKSWSFTRLVPALLVKRLWAGKVNRSQDLLPQGNSWEAEVTQTGDLSATAPTIHAAL